MKIAILTMALALGAGGFADDGLLKPIYTVPGEMQMLVQHGHVQGATCSEKAIYLSCCGGIAKLDWKTGKVIGSCTAKPHLGDIAYADGRIYGAYGLWNPPAGKQPLMVGVWDAETLQPIGEHYYAYSHPNGAKSRGLDGAVVLDGVFYTAVDHYGEGRWGHPPHRDCTIMKISVPDMKLLGTSEMTFSYPIHYGVQDMGTDGVNLLFGNYAAGPGPNFTRATRDMKTLIDYKFPASEGFGLVPKSVFGRETPIYFNVNALGGNMQGWWKDRTGNPARVRLDFHAFDPKTGCMRNITDYSAGGAAETIFISNDKPLCIDAADWKEGLPEWPSVTIPVPWVYKDFRGYDRIAVDFVNEEEKSCDALCSFISGPSGHVAKGLYNGGCTLPSAGFRRWVMPITAWKDYKEVDPAAIARVHFFLTRPHAVKLRFYRVTLLPKGVECPPPAEELVQKVVRPMLEKQYAKRGLKMPAVRTVEEIEGAQQALAEADREAERKAAAATFRSACDAAGQKGPFLLGQATSMEKIRPRKFSGVQVARELSVRLARGERESVQLLVMPRQGDLHGVKVRVSDLKGEGAAVFPASAVDAHVTGYVNITNRAPYPAGVSRPSASAPGYRREREMNELGWWPDPILGFLDGIDIAAHDLQSFWIRVRAPENQPAGVYRGTLTVSADGVGETTLPFRVRVNGFAVPKASPLPLAITFHPCPTTQWENEAGLAAAAARRKDPLSPVNQWGKHRVEWSDFLGDYYMVMDSLYLNGKSLPQFDLLERSEKAGKLVRFNLGYWDFPKDLSEAEKTRWRDTTLARLKTSYAKAKALGIEKKAYIYGCDEASTNTFDRIRWAAAEIRAAIPGIPISTTAYDDEFGAGTPLDVIDWFTPQTNKFDPGKAKASRAAGHQVWWYFACDNKAPYSNMFIECQAIEHRSFFGAQTVKYRPDGYLYYEIALWNSVRPVTGGPFTDWDPRSWTTYHGDGNWTCCGPDGTPLPTVRLENFRDGLEDYAYAKLLEEKLAADPSAPWAARARELLAVPATLVESANNFSDDPAALYAWRDEMADLIEKATANVTSLCGEWGFSKDAGRNWTQVTVPHDWAISGPFNPNEAGWSGKLPWRGEGDYRRSFDLSENDRVLLREGGKVYLEFDGVMASPRVKLNGKSVGGWDYGYMGFCLDVTDVVREKDNLLEVHCSTKHHRSRWYPGAGIYRKVRLVTRPRNHVLPGTLAITTPSVSAESATVHVEYESSVEGRKKLEFTVANPRLWSLDDPQLHEIELPGERFRYGIRDFKFTVDDGFWLNGKRVQLKGVDLHSDLGPLGMAFDRDAMKRQLLIMKDMGFNALRTSHNAPAPEVLELCDELGVFVWNECFDKWNAFAGRTNDQNLETYVADNLRQFVRRDRNHPCVFCWSIGNEIQAVMHDKEPTGMTTERFRLFRSAIRELDATRPVCIGCCCGLGRKAECDFSALDLTGWNYNASYRNMRREYPDMPVLYSESASAVSEYGYYEQPPAGSKTDYSRDTMQVGSYDHCAAPWSDIPDVEFDRMARDRYCCGEFVWTGIDYLGEPTPIVNGDMFGIKTNECETARSSYFGIVDLCGIPKDRFYIYRSHWNAKDETIHLLPHWNWKGSEGKKIPVYAYTSGDEAELFLNGRSLGRRRKCALSELPNLLSGKKATASSSECRGGKILHAPEDALTDDWDQRWCASSEKSNEWWQVDLGLKTDFDTLILMEESPGRKYELVVTVSDDGRNWREYSRHAYGSGILPVRRKESARYLRITFTRLEQGVWASLKRVILRKGEDGALLQNPYYDVCAKYRLRWFDVPYEPGELKVVAYRDGKRIGERTMRTAERPVAVKLTDDPFNPKGARTRFVQVDLVDAAGTRDPLAMDRVSFRLEGPGKIVAVGNGNPRGYDVFTDVSSHPLYYGKAVAVVRLDEGATEPVRLFADVKGLKGALLEIRSE